jgi:hypothetical protein
MNKKKVVQEREEKSIINFLGKELYQYAFPIDLFIESRKQNNQGIQACGINSFITGRKVFLKEISGGSIYGDGHLILLRRWLDHCKKPRHFKEVFFYARNTVNKSGYGLDIMVVAWEWIKILKTRKGFIDFFKVINESPACSSIDKETRLYVMQMFINLCMK